MTDEPDYCEALVREADKDRFLATLFAPAAQRADLSIVYAFDLETAAVAQRVRDPVAGEIRLQWWHEALSSAGESGHPVADAMHEVMRRHRIDPHLALGVVDARRRALYPADTSSEAEIELSASESEGAIICMAAHVLGGLPGEAVRLAAHHAGVVTALSAPVPELSAPDIAATIQRHREAVRELLPNLPDAVLPAFLPLALAVEGRKALPQWRKQWILWRASRNLARWL
jgi:phytoene synthase